MTIGGESVDFDDLVDRAQDMPVSMVVPGEPAVSWEVQPSRYYRLDGVGLWTAQADVQGVHLRRLFYGDHEYRTWAQWRAQCGSGRVREVR